MNELYIKLEINLTEDITMAKKITQKQLSKTRTQLRNEVCGVKAEIEVNNILKCGITTCNEFSLDNRNLIDDTNCKRFGDITKCQKHNNSKPTGQLQSKEDLDEYYKTEPVEVCHEISTKSKTYITGTGEPPPITGTFEKVKPFVAKDTSSKLVAAKLLLNGMCASAMKRDNKSLIEIIKSVEKEAKAAMITNKDLAKVSGMTLNEIFLDKGN